jgi:hypothetical protein
MNKIGQMECMRRIAEDFIAKHAPDERRYFPVIWNRFCGDNFFSQQFPPSSMLTFAEQNAIGLYSPSMLFVLKGVMCELKAKIDKPSLEKVRNAVRTCAVELGAPKDIAISLEQDLSMSIYENLFNLLDSVDNICNPKFPKQRYLVINSIDDIKVDGQEFKTEAIQPLTLLCELIRKNKLHWGNAFLLFPKWCNETIKAPKEQLKKLTYKINMFMQKNGLEIRTDWEIDDREKTGYVRLIVPENIEISGNIIESQKLMENSEDMIKEGRNKDALDNAVKAFNKDPGWLKPMIVFAETVARLDHEQFRNFKESLINIQRKLNYNHDIRVNAATAMRKYESANKQGIPLQEVIFDYAGEINQIIQALKKINTAYESGSIKLTPQELEYDLVCDILREMKNAVDDQFNFLYTRLCATECVKEVIQNTVIACKNNLSCYEITDENVSSYFWEYIRERISYPVECKNIEHLKGRWGISLKKRIERDFEIDSPGHGGESET